MYRSIPHKRLQTMVNMAQVQRSTVLINKWGLLAKKLLIGDNKNWVMNTLNFGR
jgi:predicted metallo-beta-lactamase superfamily hydrolase